jgi:hypothetical protein
MPKVVSRPAGNYLRKESESRRQPRTASERPELKYLVGGYREGLRENVRRATAPAAVRKARQLQRQGYVDVRICTPRGQVLLEDEFNHLET